jgi:FtsZ-binding cell division protein ZapB
MPPVPPQAGDVTVEVEELKDQNRMLQEQLVEMQRRIEKMEKEK